jgi:hypothetical protein
VGEAVGDTDGETVLGESLEGDTLGESVGVDVMSVSPSPSVSVSVSVSVSAPTRYACNPPPNHIGLNGEACWPNSRAALTSARRACTSMVDEREHRRPCRRTVLKERLSSTRGMISHVEGWGAHSTPRALRCRSRVYAWIRCVPSPGRSTSSRACSRVRDFGARSGR